MLVLLLALALVLVPVLVQVLALAWASVCCKSGVVAVSLRGEEVRTEGELRVN